MIRTLLAALVAAFVAHAAQAAPLAVVASTTILADFVREVGGDDVAVTTLVGPDGDPHVYEPKPTDVRAVAEARLVVVNGLGLEGWMERLAAAAGGKAEQVVATQGIPPLTMPDEDHPDIKIQDPHAWQDVRNAKLYAANIAAALERADPAHADAYSARLAAYQAKLDALDAEVRAQLAAVPAPKREIITTHDAFQYYGRAYGIRLLAAEGISSDTEPSAEGIARLSRQIKQGHIKALFLETIIDPRLMRQLAAESGAEVGPPLYSDALSAPDGPAPTYIAMIRVNTGRLKDGMLKN